MKPQVFADVLRKFPMPVTVVTVGRGGADNALTVSWAAPVSFDPPQMMVALDKLHYSVDFLRSQSTVYGHITTEGTVLKQDNVSTPGGITEHASVNSVTARNWGAYVAWNAFPSGFATFTGLFRSSGTIVHLCPSPAPRALSRARRMQPPTVPWTATRPAITRPFPSFTTFSPHASSRFCCARRTIAPKQKISFSKRC